MKKLLAMLGVSVLTLAACDSHHANAQSQMSGSSPNTDSADVMVVEEAYEAVVATPSNTQPATSQNNNAAANNTANTSSDNSPTIVTESVSESVTPNSVSYEVDEMSD